jgi:hypothetical protein
MRQASARSLHLQLGRFVGQPGGLARLPALELERGLFVELVEEPEAGEGELTRLASRGASVLLRALRLVGEAPHAVVAHGWLAALAGRRVADRAGVPLVVSAPGGVRSGWEPRSVGDEELRGLVSWACRSADRVVVQDQAARQALRALAGVDDALIVVAAAGDEARTTGDLYRTLAEHRPAPSGRAFDVAVRAEGGAPAELDRLLTRHARTVTLKGATPSAWAEACASARVAVVLDGDVAATDLALDRACLPVGPARDDLIEEVSRWLEDDATRCRRVRTLRSTRRAAATVRGGQAVREQAGRALRIAINQGGFQASDLHDSVAPLGWEVRSLLAGGRPDPLPGADFLLVLPYGDPRGALAALRRARRMAVPTVFWNVEDPRYFLDDELGPIVRDLAREATLTLSSTRQLEEEYRGLGVDLRYLPNFGRGYYRVEEPVPEAERAIDLLFLGSFTPERRAFLDALRERLGPGVAFVARDDVRDPPEVRELVASARLGLSVGTLTDVPGRTRGEGLTERVYDFALAGTPVLSDERAHLADHFTPGDEVFVFRDVDDAAAQVRALLADPERRASAAAKARADVLARHLGRHRLIEIASRLQARGALSAACGAEMARVQASMEVSA